MNSDSQTAYGGINVASFSVATELLFYFAIIDQHGYSSRISQSWSIYLSNLFTFLVLRYLWKVKNYFSKAYSGVSTILSNVPAETNPQL